MMALGATAGLGGVASAKSDPPPPGNNVGIQAAPANDNKASATVITGASGSSTAQTTVDATLETDELGIFDDTSDSTSVWYSWTAPTNDTVTFRTVLGTLSDSTLGAYTPGSFPLTAVATNDDTSGLASQIIFAPVQGSTYLIRVAGFNGTSGTFDLAWFTDTTDPTIDSLSLKVRGPKVVAELTGSDDIAVARFECFIDSDPNASCSSPWTSADVAKGEHTFYLNVVDTSGNTTQDSLNFTIKSGKVKI
jgi:hypothetical protein